MNRKSNVRIALLLVLSIILVAAVGCTTAPKKQVLQIWITATSDLNPDLDSRPSPIILNVFELSSVEEFERADFFTLTRPDASGLGGDVVNRTEIILTPGSEKALSLELGETVSHIGFVAGYRDIDTARWRASQPVSAGKNQQISVSLDKGQVSVTSVDN